MMLKVTDLKVSYGMIEAIKGISFEVRDGEIVTLSEPTAPERPRRCTPSPDS